MFLTKDFPPSPPPKLLIVEQKDFAEWTSLNDTIMGGASQASCTVTSKGLLLNGILIAEGGGFVSCRSPFFSPSLNLSKYRGLQIEVDGQGRTLKFGVSCESSVFGLGRLLSGNLRWVASIPTKKEGMTTIRIPFDSLEPAIRAKPVILPVKFDPSCINQFQLLHSKFGQSGKMNPGFKPGPIRILLSSINAYS